MINANKRFFIINNLIWVSNYGIIRNTVFPVDRKYKIVAVTNHESQKAVTMSNTQELSTIVHSLVADASSLFAKIDNLEEKLRKRKREESELVQVTKKTRVGVCECNTTDTYSFTKEDVFKIMRQLVEKHVPELFVCEDTFFGELARDGVIGDELATMIIHELIHVTPSQDNQQWQDLLRAFKKKFNNLQLV